VKNKKGQRFRDWSPIGKLGKDELKSAVRVIWADKERSGRAGPRMVGGASPSTSPHTRGVDPRAPRAASSSPSSAKSFAASPEAFSESLTKLLAEKAPDFLPQSGASHYTKPKPPQRRPPSQAAPSERLVEEREQLLSPEERLLAAKSFY